VIGVCDDCKRVAKQKILHDVFGRGRGSQRPDQAVDIAFAQGPQQLIIAAFDNPDLKTFNLTDHRVDCLWGNAGARKWQAAKYESPLFLPDFAADFLKSLPDLGLRQLRPAHKSLGRGGQSDARRTGCEKGDACDGFKAARGAVNGGLRQAEAMGGHGEAARVCDGYQVAQLGGCDRHIK
jgi:hypothetical protein